MRFLLVFSLGYGKILDKLQKVLETSSLSGVSTAADFDPRTGKSRHT